MFLFPLEEAPKRRALLISLLTDLVNTNGGVYFPFQETSGSVSLAVNPALALGRNILLEGAFPSNPGVWNLGGSWTIAGGKATYDDTSTGRALFQSTPIQGGATYTVTFDISELSSTDVRLSFNNNSGSIEFVPQEGYEAGSFSRSFTAPSSSSTFGLFGHVAGAGTGKITNIVLKQTDILASSTFPGSEELTDGDMEKVGTTDWQALNSATLSKETGTRTGGSGVQVLRIARNASANPGAREVNLLTVGKRYRVVAWARSDGNATPSIGGGAPTTNGTTSTDWQQFDFEFVATSANINFTSTTNTGTEYTEWDDISVTEANPLNGDITGATINQSAGSKLKKSYSFDKTNDFVDVYSAEINSIFDPTKGTLLCFAKVSGAGVWEDGAQRFLVGLRADATNFIQITKDSVNNQLKVSYNAGGTREDITPALTATDYFMAAVTWNSTGNFICYVNGVQSGTPQAIGGTWVGNLLSTQTVLGAISTTPSNVWDGELTHPQLLTEVLSATEILSIARRGGTA